MTLVLTYLTDHYAPTRLNLSAPAEEQLAVAVRRLNAYVGHPVDFDELSKDLLLGWLKALAKKGQAAATINGKRSAILCLWQAAYGDGLAPEPPRAREIPTKRAPRRLPNSWTVEQMAAIVTHCRRVTGTFRYSGIRKADFLSSLVLFQYDTATRLGASLAVRPQDLDLATGLVYLRSETAKTGLEQAHWLSADTLNAIARHWAADRDFVWPWGPNRHGLWSALRAVLKASGLPSDRRSMFHRFRRTTATILTGKVGISAASAALGHTSEAMTRRYVDPANLPAVRPIDVLPRLRASG